MGKYGEPLQERDGYLLDCDGNYADIGCTDRVRHYVACVNAMEGKNPDGLNDAVRMLDVATTHLEAIEPASEFVRFLRADMRAALKKLGALE